MPSTERFEPHAARAMASMFDDVSGRYDLLNRVMTLGQDGAWREAMWRAVPADARVVLDLCTGSGVSLPGLRRPGRTVLGIDVSLAMLEVAEERHGGPGWSPRLACADAFHLPLRDGALDAVTVAFGVRNLRPRVTSLAEIARVLRPGGVLVVLEATAPAPGPLAPGHRAWIRYVIPFAGRLSPDPTAYRYLSESILEFGAGPEFERDLAVAGFEVAARRSFLLGATRLWVARRPGSVGQNRAATAGAVRNATPGSAMSGRDAQPAGGPRTWLGVAMATSLALTLALAWGLVEWINSNAGLPLSPAQRLLGWGLLIAGLLVFGSRSVWLALRWVAAARPR
jgi:demethylmenaquinone methyltransferase/2-methoxy-6-polyprenyl-1,4-benzoquinol methylase